MTRPDLQLPEFAYTGTLELYRLCKTQYADLSGLGAAMFPSRWNHKGRRAVYTATSQALAMAEVLVHLPRTSRPIGYSMITIELKSGADIVIRRSLEDASLWFSRFGAALSEAPDDPIGLAVPSVLVPEYNVVLYPRAERFEPGFASIKSVVPFQFDERLFDQPALAAAKL